VVLWIELRNSLGEAGWGDDTAWFGSLGLLGIMVDRVIIAYGTREHHDVRRLDGECDLGHRVPSVSIRSVNVDPAFPGHDLR
jgi:hypothetical protein